MKNLLLTLILFFTLINVGLSQTNTIHVEDTILGSAQRWRDTCFGLINKSGIQIPVRNKLFSCI